MNAPRRTFSPALVGLLACLAVAGSHSRGEEISAPPELHDVATGEVVSAAETARTRDFGAVVQAAGHPGLRASMKDGAPVAQLKSGDLILGLDGWRTHDFREFEVARLKQPTEPRMALLVNRRGILEMLKLTDLPPGRNLGVSFDEAVERSSFADVVENCGLPLDAPTRAARLSLPRDAAAALDVWRREAGAQPDPAWVQDFLKLYLAVQQRRYADVAVPAHASPVPLFQRLTKFYLAIAEKNKAHEFLPANWADYGESAEFFVLHRPLPTFVPPPLGDAKFSDPKFRRLLESRRTDFRTESSELSTAARTYLLSGADRMEQFLNQAKAALLDPAAQGGWPFRSSLIAASEERLVMLGELRKRLANAADPDWPLLAYATVGPLSLEALRPEAAVLIQQLGKRSPFLAWSAAELCFTASRASKNFPRRGLPRVRQVVASNDFFLPKDAPEIFRWALRKIPPILEENTRQIADTLDPTPLLTGSPILELQALQIPEKNEAK